MLLAKWLNYKQSHNNALNTRESSPTTEYMQNDNIKPTFRPTFQERSLAVKDFKKKCILFHHWLLWWLEEVILWNHNDNITQGSQTRSQAQEDLQVHRDFSQQTGRRYPACGALPWPCMSQFGQIMIVGIYIKMSLADSRRHIKLVWLTFPQQQLSTRMWVRNNRTYRWW